MMISLRSARNAAAGAVGAGALAGAMLFGGIPAAQAAPLPAPGTSFATFGPHGGPGGPGIIPERPGGGHFWGHGGGGHISKTISWGQGSRGGHLGRGFGNHGMGRGFDHHGFGRGFDHHGFGHRGFGGHRGWW